VDLNFLCDYNFDLFFQNVENFTVSALQYNIDILSLFISSLESTDVTQSKYSIMRKSKNPSANKFEGDNKVNSVCTAIREVLLRVIQKSLKVEKINGSVINPILCTYAKHRPSLLVEAVEAIKQFVGTMSDSSK
jgi:hypothetical protein